jgi:filamentous hemagglutinin family protein
MLKISIAAALAAFATSALANPTGAAVVSGNATFVSNGSVLTITSTPGSVINWQQFNIGQNEVTRFIQQNPNSTVLNRVIGSNPSAIFGTLQSNGHVFLANPNGIVASGGAVINVNGLHVTGTPSFVVEGSVQLIAGTISIDTGPLVLGGGALTSGPYVSGTTLTVGAGNLGAPGSAPAGSISTSLPGLPLITGNSGSTSQAGGAIVVGDGAKASGVVATAARRVSPFGTALVLQKREVAF